MRPGAKARLQAMVVPDDIKELEEKIEQLKKEKESYIKIQDFERAAKMRDQEREVREAAGAQACRMDAKAR